MKILKFLTNKLKTSNWYKIDGNYIHYYNGYLNGVKLSIKDRYEFEKDNFDLIY